LPGGCFHRRATQHLPSPLCAGVALRVEKIFTDAMRATYCLIFSRRRFTTLAVPTGLHASSQRRSS
jgi:hypothetical protein